MRFVLTACNVTCFVDPWLCTPNVIASSLLRNPGISASTLASALLWRSPLPCWNCSLPWTFLLSSWTLLSILYLLPSCSPPPKWNLRKSNLLRYDMIDTQQLTLFSTFTVAYASKICLYVFQSLVRVRDSNRCAICEFVMKQLETMLEDQATEVGYIQFGHWNPQNDASPLMRFFWHSVSGGGD